MPIAIRMRGRWRTGGCTVFRHLVELHYREHRPLDFYAGALGMTRRTLSRLTAAGLDCSPMEVVHRRLALEARRLLRYTNASAVQVAAELGFDDPSYFLALLSQDKRGLGPEKTARRVSSPPPSRFAPFAPERDPAMDRRADAGGKGLEREEARFRDFPPVRPGRVVGLASHHFDAVAPPRRAWRSGRNRTRQAEQGDTRSPPPARAWLPRPRPRHAQDPPPGSIHRSGCW